MGWSGVLIKCTEHWGSPWANWGNPQTEHSQWPWVGFLMESIKWLVWSVSLWWSLRALAAVLSASSCALSCSTPRYSGWVVKEVGLFGSIPYSWGNLMLTYVPSPPFREIMGWDLLWHWVLLLWGRGDSDTAKLFLLPSSMCKISFFFFSIKVVCLNFSAELLDFHKVTLVSGWLSKSVLFGRRWQKTLISPLLLFFS